MLLSFCLLKQKLFGSIKIRRMEVISFNKYQCWLTTFLSQFYILTPLCMRIRLPWSEQSGLVNMDVDTDKTRPARLWRLCFSLVTQVVAALLCCRHNGQSEGVEVKKKQTKKHGNRSSLLDEPYQGPVTDLQPLEGKAGKERSTLYLFTPTNSDRKKKLFN